MPMPKNRVILKCEHCQKTFEVKASLAKSYRFCSMTCRTKARTEIIVCAQCGKVFTKQKCYKARYCSLSCSTTARNLTKTNPSYHRDISGKKNPMYGKGQFGKDNGMFGKTREQNPSWKGGRKVRKDGYILVYAPNHPRAINNGNNETTYILEHRLIMENHLGRFLEPEEVVHHIDGNPQNNSITNLHLYKNQAEHITKGHS